MIRGTIALVVAAMLLHWGCGSPESRYRVLSIFFDGVPSPYGDGDDSSGSNLLKKKKKKKLTASTHGPYAAKQCNLCHTNAASNDLKLPKESLCASCHLIVDFTGEMMHGPVAGGQCAYCHSPHRSEHAHLLVETVPGLCERCHSVATFQDYEKHRLERGGDCLRCHEPHAGRAPSLLVEGVEP